MSKSSFIPACIHYMNKITYYALLSILLMGSQPHSLSAATETQTSTALQHISQVIKLHANEKLLVNMVVGDNQSSLSQRKKYQKVWASIAQETLGHQPSIRPQGASCSLLRKPGQKGISLFNSAVLGLIIDGFDTTGNQPNKTLTPIFFQSPAYNGLCSIPIAGFAHYIHQKHKVSFDTMQIKYKNLYNGPYGIFIFSYQNKRFSVRLKSSQQYKEEF